MGTRNKVAVWVAAVTLATGAVVAITSGSAAHAATVDCGNGCVEPYTQEYGTANVAAVDAGATEPGLGVGLGVAGAYSTEDFTIIKEGQVSGLYQKGIVRMSWMRRGVRIWPISMSTLRTVC